MMELLADIGRWFIDPGLRIILIIVLTLIGFKLIDYICGRFFSGLARGHDLEFQKRADTMNNVIRNLLGSIIIGIAVVMIMDKLDIPIGPILTAAGVVGIAVGFGAQSLVKDIIAGFFILLDDQIRVGDVVEITGKSGVVEKISLRMTILRDAGGNVHFVRNGEINVVTNMTKEYSRYVFDIGVAYKEDVDEVTELLKKVDDEIRGDPAFAAYILEPLEVLGLDKFGDSAITIKARIKTVPVKQWMVGREYNRRIKKLFDEKKIEIPFPHLTLYMGHEKGALEEPQSRGSQISKN